MQQASIISFFANFLKVVIFFFAALYLTVVLSSRFPFLPFSFLLEAESSALEQEQGLLAERQDPNPFSRESQSEDLGTQSETCTESEEENEKEEREKKRRR